MFSRQAFTISELKKALTTGNSPALTPDELEKTLYEELTKLQPLATLMGFKQAEGLTHSYNVRTAHPKAWFEGEETAPNAKRSTYARKSVQLKIARIWGSVAGFAQAVDEKFIDALAAELAGSVQGMSDLLEYGALYGTANDIGFTGDAYQYSGVLPRMYAYAPENVVDAGGDKVTLADLDAAIGKSAKHRQTRMDPYVWLMSQSMKQVTDGLQTKIQLPLQSVTIADGKVEMAAYGGRAILESDFVSPEADGTSPACTAVVAAGGALTAATYNYRISSVTAYGEQIAGTASANVVAATTNLSADLSWTADANAVLYMIWRKTGSSSYQLLDIIPALTYSSDGTVNGTVATYSDEGALSTKAVKPLETGEQVIATFNLHPTRGAGFIGKVDDMGRQVESVMSFVELARVKDTYDYLLKSYLAAKVPYPNLASVVRHVKLA